MTGPTAMPTRRSRRRDILRPDCLAIRTCLAAMRAAKPSICAFPLRTSVRSRFPTAWRTIRSSSCQTSSPTGWMAAENVCIEEGDTVAICGCGPVGQFAIQSAWMMDAGRVIAIDQVPEWCIQRRASCDHRRRGCDLRHQSGSAAAEERKDLETVGCTVEPVKSDVCFPAKGQLHRTALLEAHSRHTGPQHCLLR